MIRLYQPRDLDRLKEITAICFEHVSIDRKIEEKFGRLGGRDWRWRKLRHIDADVEGDHAHSVFVCEEDGAVVGYITTRLDHQSKIGWIPNLAVLPQYQGKGLGRQLMDKALEHLRANNMECAKIETLAHNEVGSQFYPSVGFEEITRQIHYAMRL